MGTEEAGRSSQPSTGGEQGSRWSVSSPGWVPFYLAQVPAPTCRARELLVPWVRSS